MRNSRKSIWNYVREYKFNGLFFKNFAYIIGVVILPMLLVVSMNYRNFNLEVNNHMMDMNQELLQKSAAVVDNIVEDLLENAEKVSQTENIVQSLVSRLTKEQHEESMTLAMTALRENTVSNSFLSAAKLYLDKQQVLVTNETYLSIDRDVFGEKWYSVYKNVRMDKPYILANDRQGIFVCKQLYNPTLGRVGILALEVDFQKIRDVLETSKVNQKGRFFLIDYSGEVLYCSDPKWFLAEPSYRQSDEELIDRTFDDASASKYLSDKVLSVEESAHQSWCYMLISEAPVFEEETRATRNFLLSSIVVAICTGILASVIITVVTYRPVRKILDVLKKPQPHWSDTYDRESSELLYVTSNIMNTLNKKEELSQELNERLKMLREAQFRSLQFQIDPHFLYNTLENIKWCAVEELGLGNKVSKMISKMARFYRVGLENNDVIVTIRQEIEFLKLYAEIISIRFGDSITFRWNVDESLLESNIIKMCMQPLVENAINHGLRPKAYCGNIFIDVFHDEHTIYVAVRNDGEAMNKQSVAQMNEKLRSGIGFKENAVGLKNVNERIKLVYGEKYGVQMECDLQQEENSEENVVDMRVIMTFPYVE